MPSGVLYVGSMTALRYRRPPTGAQLKALLTPASWFPRGFKIDPQGSVDTGNYYQPATPPGALECSKLDGTSWVQLGNGSAVSFAQNDYLDQNAGQYAQEIDVYQGSAAQDVMAKLRQVAASCRSFHEAQTSSTVTVTLETGPRLGDDALTVRLKDPRWLGGSTLEAVRVGHAVATVYSLRSAARARPRPPGWLPSSRRTSRRTAERLRLVASALLPPACSRLVALGPGSAPTVLWPAPWSPGTPRALASRRQCTPPLAGGKHVTSKPAGGVGADRVMDRRGAPPEAACS
jgi:hypothetical protein